MSGAPLPTLEGERVRLRPGTAADVDALVEVRADPTVVEWWGPLDRTEITTELLGHDPETTMLVVEVGGELAGAIEFHEEPGPMFRFASIDIFLGARWQGAGLGREAVGVLLAYLFGQRGHHRVTIDPATINQRAVRSYAAAGFREVGILREYQKMPDGRRLDATLMELLRSDWSPSGR